jgi:arginase family enzyme
VAVDDPLWPRAGTWLASEDPAPDLVIAGVPSSASAIPSETWRTPAAFRSALDRFGVFDGETGTDLRSVAVRDLGDWDVAGLDMHEAPRVVERNAAALGGGPAAVFLGGGSAITRALVKGLAGGDLTSVGILTIGAHHDVRTTELGPADGSQIRGLVEDGLPDGRVIQLGIRSFAGSSVSRAYCEDHGIEIITLETVDEVGAGWAVRSAMGDLATRCDWIYVHVDIGVLDVAFAPGCAGARPGGMLPRQLAAAVRAAGAHPAVRAAVFVEVDAARDPAGVTVMNMAWAFLAFVSGFATREERDV